MTKRITAFILAVMAVSASADLLAHDQFHIVGIITKREPMTIVVKPKGPVENPYTKPLPVPEQEKK